jgi:hypothetical protein
VRIVFLSEARDEFLAGISYYESEHSGLGQRFKDEIDRCVIWISEHYLLYRVRARGHRRINCRVFPYNISFVVHDKTLWILSVAHSARQPEYWIERKIKS